MEEELGSRYRCDRHDCNNETEVGRFSGVPDSWYEVSITGEPPQFASQTRRKEYHYCSFEHMIDGVRKRMDTMEQRRRDQEARAAAIKPEEEDPRPLGHRHA